MPTKKGVIILSGGLDSTVLLHQLVKKEQFDLHALSFNYGQKHSKEIQCAQYQSNSLNVPHRIIDLGFINECFNSALLSSGNAIPEGHYEDENMKQTVVPNRNMILLSIAGGYAISHKHLNLFYGAHAGDHAIYPDCRTEFIDSVAHTLTLCDWEKTSLQVPFQNLKKDQIVKKGLQLDVDFSHTWTCYKGKSKPCGKCGSCTERIEAFALNGMKDPLMES